MTRDPNEPHHDNPITGDELAQILGANGLEETPWFRPGILERVNAEVLRLCSVLGLSCGEIAIVNVVINDATTLVPWLRGIAERENPIFAEAIRASGSTADGHLVWPGNRRALAHAWRSCGEDRMASLLDEPPPHGFLKVVVHWPHETGPRCAVVIFQLSSPDDLNMAKA